jgi:acyloxyacyl hydrolase
MKTLRGTSWRGKDCNDADSKIHPGAKGGNDSAIDSNCNGIQVYDIVLLLELLNSVKLFRVLIKVMEFLMNINFVKIHNNVVFYHLVIPLPHIFICQKNGLMVSMKYISLIQIYNILLFEATKISEEAFKHAAFIVENEADWPQLSGSTGHIQNQWPVVDGNTSSLYLKLWERNKCNFRDYQNVGVNGMFKD